MGDKNEDHVIQEAEDERGVQTETMNGHSVRGPNGVESETGGAGCSSSVEGLTLRAKLIKKLFSVLRGWVAKEVVALSRLAIPIVSLGYITMYKRSIFMYFWHRCLLLCFSNSHFCYLCSLWGILQVKLLN